MKKFKTKTYDYKKNGDHIKLMFQWIRGGDAEVTLIVVKGKHKNLSGFFAVAPTKKEALSKLHEFCCRYYAGIPKDVVNLVPWADVIKTLDYNEKQAQKSR